MIHIKATHYQKPQLCIMLRCLGPDRRRDLWERVRWRKVLCRLSVGANSAESFCPRILCRTVASTKAVAKRSTGRSSWWKPAARNPRPKTHFSQTLAFAFSSAGVCCFSAWSGDQVGRCRARAVGLLEGEPALIAWKKIPPPNLTEPLLRMQGLKLSAAWSQYVRFLSTGARA